jgi:hypothetical protein
VDQDQYDRVSRRIQQMDMEQDRPARVMAAYSADVIDLPDQRWQWGLLGLGATLLFSILLLIVRQVLRLRPSVQNRP